MLSKGGIKIETDYNITFFEACKILKKSKRTVSRYIKKGLIKPEKIKSQKESVEYRFKQADLKSLKKDTLKAKETLPG